MVNILLGVSGSVAAIKIPEILEVLSTVDNCHVKVVVTEHSRHFLPQDLTLLGNLCKSVLTDEEEWTSWRQRGDPVLHIELRKWADIAIIAPLSANTLAKLSNGIADNLLTSVMRAWDFTKPCLIAPAMNTAMWEHPATEHQLNILQTWGYNVIQPISKTLVCGDTGMGAMATVDSIIQTIKDMVKISSLSSSNTSTGTLTESTVIGGDIQMTAADWKSCNICLDEMPDSDLICHIECTAQLCRDCKERAETANPGKCPVCLNQCHDTEWVQLDMSKGVKPALRMLTVNTMFMTRNASEIVKFGHPRLIKLPNLVRVSNLLEVVESMVRQSITVEIHNRVRVCLVTDTGDSCSRCQDNCDGCDVVSLQDEAGEIVLKPADNIAVLIEDLDKNVIELFNKTKHDSSMESERFI